MLLTLHRALFSTVLAACIGHRLLLPVAVLCIAPALAQSPMILLFKIVLGLAALASLFLPPALLADLARRSAAAASSRPVRRGRQSGLTGGASASMRAVGFALLSVGLSAAAAAGMAGAGGGESVNVSAGLLAVLLGCQTLYYAIDAAFLVIDLRPRPLPASQSGPAGA